MINDRKQWLNLICRYSDGAITSEEIAALEAEMRRNPELRKDFIEYFNVDVTLKDYAEKHILDQSHLATKKQGVASMVWANLGLVSALGRFWRPPVIWAAGVAVLLVLLTGWWVMRVDRGGVNVKILASQDAQISHARLSLSPGSTTKLDHLELAGGKLSLKLDSDVQVDFTGPVDVQFLSPMHLLLRRGQLRAQVMSERGKGFTVETVRGKVVDLGTIFGVALSPVGAMDVIVFKGSVQVYRNENNHGVDTLLSILKAGEGMRMSRPQFVGPVPSVFLIANNWTTTPPAQSPILSVRDRLTGSDTNRFYRVWVGGMKPGVPARHGGWYKWIPTEGAAFPSWLQNADLVETFTHDRVVDDFWLSLELSKPSVVYIFQDLRHGPPQWLRNQFTNTGEQIQLLRFDSEKDDLTNSVQSLERNPFAVWKSKPLPAGEFILGPRRQPAQFKAGEMYGVAVKAEP